MEEAKLRETMLETTEVYSGRLLHVRSDKIRLPDGGVSGREYIRHNGAVAIIPVTDSGEVIIERQFRYPVDEVITEIPAGKLDTKDEPRLDAAKRELREETGITADEWTDLGTFYPTSAYSDEVITIYMARGLHYGERELDEGEFLNVEAVPLADLVNSVMAGEIPDGKTQAAVLKAARILGI